VRDNYNALVIDLRDHGESGGTYAGPGYTESRDVLGALRYMQNRGETQPLRSNWVIPTVLSLRCTPPANHGI
jgi:alpha/beta superfamily hydrolase